MISAKDAIACGRALLGTPYSELDCINFIKKIIRTAPGGVPGYTVAGTNSLWKSAEASGKYRDLIWTQEGIFDAEAGMLAFKRDGSDVHHVGLVTGAGTVLHSSSAKGCVVETALDNSWALLAMHRYIQTAEESEETAEAVNKAEGGDGTVLFRAEVVTQRDPLNVREKPHIMGKKLGELPLGALVDVLSEGDGSWWRVRLEGLVGYASSGYLRRIEEDTILPDSAKCEPAKSVNDAAGDICAVPRAQLLALADAAEAVNAGWGMSFAALTGKIGTLINAARAVTKALEGDD